MNILIQTLPIAHTDYRHQIKLNTILLVFPFRTSLDLPPKLSLLVDHHLGITTVISDREVRVRNGTSGWLRGASLVRCNNNQI